METKKKTYFPLSLSVGCIVVAAIAAVIWVVEKCNGITLLATEEDRIANYLSLMGLSFSVTFITTSLFGGLSDKSEKIYWLSYPESYLINSTLNFMTLSTLSFVCLGTQAAVTVMMFLPEEVRESVFFSSFLIGIISIVILSYRFTAVFFRRKKLVKKAERRFDKMIKDENCKQDLQRAVVGLFNNTLEAVSPDSSNFERVSENINLLLKYSDNDTCNFWLKRLIVEIGRSNTSMLSQLVLELEGASYYAEFTHMLEIEVLNKDVPFDGMELLNTIYDVRLNEFMKKLGEGHLFVDGAADGDTYKTWSNVARDLNILLTKIDTSRLDNCIFVLKNLKELPFELLQNSNCMKKIADVWDSILKFLTICINESDTVSYQQLEKLIIDFLLAHPSAYFDTDMMFGCVTREQLSDDLHKKTAAVIGKMNSDQLSYMIDVIEEDADRTKFLKWLTERMAEGEIPEALWGLDKQSDYDYKDRYFYAKDFSNCVIAELISKRKALKNSYIERDSDPEKDRYEYNVEILEYNRFVAKFIKLLNHVKQYEETCGDKAVDRFLKVLINDVCVGEANSFEHDSYDPFWEEGDGKETTILNCYVNAFELLLKEQDGLSDLSNAIKLTDGNGEPVKNYFMPSSEEETQKRKELLFFLEHIAKQVEMDEINSENMPACAEIIAAVLTNPCIGPVSREASKNPDEVNVCLEILRNTDTYRNITLKYIADMNEEYSVLDCLYLGASSRQSFGEMEYAAFLQDVAEAYDNALLALGDAVNQK